MVRKTPPPLLVSLTLTLLFHLSPTPEGVKTVAKLSVDAMANLSEARDGSQSEKCFLRMKICFLYARTKGVVFYPACLLHCGECF